nr:centrin-3 [Quercus suber]
MFHIHRSLASDQVIRLRPSSGSWPRCALLSQYTHVNPRDLPNPNDACFNTRRAFFRIDDHLRKTHCPIQVPHPIRVTARLDVRNPLWITYLGTERFHCHRLSRHLCRNHQIPAHHDWTISRMAAPNQHGSFPSRPYNTTLNRPSGSAFQPSATLPYAAPQASGPNPLTSGTQQQREAARLERERHERAERERRDAEANQALENLSEEQREEINEAFSLFDLDKDEHIDYHELKVAFKALGFDLAKGEVLNILQTHGVSAATVHNAGGSKAPQNQQQQPTFTGPSRLLLPHVTFMHLAAQKIALRDPREEILRAFELFDSNGTGLIRLEDLRRVARELGEGLQEEELQAMIDEFDIRGEGGINREEFVGICMG